MICNGDFLQKDPNEAMNYLNELAKKAHTWTSASAFESTNRVRSTVFINLERRIILGHRQMFQTIS